jgi:hypothetical protein
MNFFYMEFSKLITYLMVLLISWAYAHNFILFFFKKKEPFDWPITNNFGILGTPRIEA